MWKLEIDLRMYTKISRDVNMATKGYFVGGKTCIARLGQIHEQN